MINKNFTDVAKAFLDAQEIVSPVVVENRERDKYTEVGKAYLNGTIGESIDDKRAALEALDCKNECDNANDAKNAAASNAIGKYVKGNNEQPNKLEDAKNVALEKAKGILGGDVKGLIDPTNTRFDDDPRDEENLVAGAGKTDPTKLALAKTAAIAEGRDDFLRKKVDRALGPLIKGSTKNNGTSYGGGGAADDEVRDTEASTGAGFNANPADNPLIPKPKTGASAAPVDSARMKALRARLGRTEDLPSILKAIAKEKKRTAPPVPGARKVTFGITTPESEIGKETELEEGTSAQDYIDGRFKADHAAGKPTIGYYGGHDRRMGDIIKANPKGYKDDPAYIAMENDLEYIKKTPIKGGYFNLPTDISGRAPNESFSIDIHKVDSLWEYIIYSNDTAIVTGKVVTESAANRTAQRKLDEIFSEMASYPDTTSILNYAKQFASK